MDSGNLASGSPPEYSCFPSPGQMQLCIAALFMYFAGRLVYFAMTISPYVPPDEVTHLGICRIFSQTTLLPVNSTETYQYGLVTNIPWLYYWLMGKFLSLNVFGMSDLVFLRFCNIPLALATVYFTWRTLRLLTDDRLTQILLLVFMTNTMMLSFISAFVSYDNLTNILAAMSIYYLLAFCKRPGFALLGMLLISQLAGSLTKFTFLPLALVLNVILLFHLVSRRREYPDGVRSFFSGSVRSSAPLALVVLVGLALNLHLYGGNYLRYGTIKPDMKDVLSFQIALENRIAAREMAFNLFREGRLSREQALGMAMQISHQGDRADALFMIENYDRFRKSGDEPIGLLRYLPFWVMRMATGVFGVFGHLVIPAAGPQTASVALLAAVALVAFCRTWRPVESERLPSYLVMIAVFYTIVLIALNYEAYLYSMAPNMGLQGRYIFPVIGSIYLLASYYLMRLFRERHWRLAMLVSATAVFIASDFPLFLARVTSEWYSRV